MVVAFDQRDDAPLILTPRECRFEREPRKVWREMSMFQDRFQEEFGYAPPVPHHIKAKIEGLRKINLMNLDDNGQIVSAAQEALAPFVQEYFQSAPNIGARLKRLFRLNPRSLTIRNKVFTNPAEMVLQEYWLTWLGTGESPREQFLEVGLSTCQMHLFLAEEQCHILWWERETDELTEVVIEELFGDLRQGVMGLRHGDAATQIARIWARCLEMLFEPMADVTSQARDRSFHLYQNPFWERFWRESGMKGRSEDLSLRNRHPKSGSWMNESAEFVLPDTLPALDA